MALTQDPLARIRRLFRVARPNHTANSSQINSASNAIIDAFTTQCRPILGNAIETAAPGVFTAAQKSDLVAAVITERLF